jgi:hypothetical protein
MYPALLGPQITVPISAVSVTATGSSAQFNLGLGDCYQLTLVIGTVTGTSPTLDTILQTSYDKGTTYQNLPIRWTQKTGSTTVETATFRCGIGNNEVATLNVVAATGGQLVKNCIFDPKYMKLGYTVSGTSPVFPVTLVAYVIPRGAAER